MSMKIERVARTADGLVRRLGTRDPWAVARELGVEVLPRAFSRQNGAYKLIMRNPFIFIRSDLDEVMSSIVLAHELGHHCLHRREAEIMGGFQEFNLFSLQNDRLEYEANVFASQLLLSDEAVLECVELGYDLQETAFALRSDVNLLALKLDTLIAEGHLLLKHPHAGRYLAPGREGDVRPEDGGARRAGFIS